MLQAPVRYEEPYRRRNSAVSTFRARTWYTPRRFQQTWKITALAKEQLHHQPILKSVTPDIIAESWKFG